MATRTDVNWLSLDEIDVEDGFNVRQDYGDIEALAQSIIENGIKTPLRGHRPSGSEKIIITDGHRRLRAARLAHNKGFTDLKIPLIKEGNSTSEADKVLNMVICNDGKRLNMFEEGEVYKRLINYGWDVPDIAKKTGKSQQWLRDCITALNNSTETLRTLVAEGKVSSTTVSELLKKEDKKTVETKLKTAVEANDGQKVSNKHILPQKPTKKQICEVIEGLIDEDAKTAINAFQQYCEGSISEVQFYQKIQG